MIVIVSNLCFPGKFLGSTSADKITNDIFQVNMPTHVSNHVDELIQREVFFLKPCIDIFKPDFTDVLL